MFKYAAARQFHRRNQAIQDTTFEQWQPTRRTKWRCFTFFYVLMHSLPGIVDGARKTSQVGRSVIGAAQGRRRRLSSLPMLEATSSRDQRIIERCNVYPVPLSWWIMVWADRRSGCGAVGTAIRHWLLLVIASSPSDWSKQTPGELLVCIVGCGHRSMRSERFNWSKMGSMTCDYGLRSKPIYKNIRIGTKITILLKNYILI